MQGREGCLGGQGRTRIFGKEYTIRALLYGLTNLLHSPSGSGPFVRAYRVASLLLRPASSRAPSIYPLLSAPIDRVSVQSFSKQLRSNCLKALRPPRVSSVSCVRLYLLRRLNATYRFRPQAWAKGKRSNTQTGSQGRYSPRPCRPGPRVLRALFCQFDNNSTDV